MKSEGKVKFFNTVKGYGFITVKDTNEEIFVHQSVIHAPRYRSLADGEDVEFDINTDPEKGRKFATNVTGPNGVYVKGSEKKDFQNNNNYNNNYNSNYNNNDNNYNNNNNNRNNEFFNEFNTN